MLESEEKGLVNRFGCAIYVEEAIGLACRLVVNLSKTVPRNDCRILFRKRLELLYVP